MNTNRRQLIKTLFFAPVAALAASVAIGRTKMEPEPCRQLGGWWKVETTEELRDESGTVVATVTFKTLEWREPTENNQ